MAEIILTDGTPVLVDEADLPLLIDRTWTHLRAGRIKTKHYAVSSDGPRTVYMHRLLLDAPDGLLVDHRNGDGLDNRRANLRLATPSENARHSRRKSASGFRGVYRSGKFWQVQITVDGKNRFFLKSPKAEVAAGLYDALALQLHGEFAALNFPAVPRPSGDQT